MIRCIFKVNVLRHAPYNIAYFSVREAEAGVFQFRNPSCAYDVRWVCPLAPRENWISTSMRAGEQKYPESA